MQIRAQVTGTIIALREIFPKIRQKMMELTGSLETAKSRENGFFLSTKPPNQSPV